MKAIHNRTQQAGYKGQNDSYRKAYPYVVFESVASNQGLGDAGSPKWGIARAVLPPITHPKIKTSGCMPTANPILIKIGVIIASTAVFDIKFVSTVNIRIPTIRRTMGEAFSPPKTPSINQQLSGRLRWHPVLLPGPGRSREE